MKRLSDEEKRQLGFIIHYYRNQYFRSQLSNSDDFKQTNFCKDICSQAQLSRLEHGDALRDQDIYEQLLKKLNLSCEKIANKDIMIFDSYFENILTYQNDDQIIINYNEYVLMINKYQNIFKHNIIYTHYNYALEFILVILNDDLEEAYELLEYVENSLDILPPKYLVLTLHYLGIYYQLTHEDNKANKFYLTSMEHMHKFEVNNPIVYVDVAYNYMTLNKSIYALSYLSKGLDAFGNTKNYGIFEKIFRCFGIVDVKNKYYDDGFNMFTKALNFAKKANKSEMIMLDYSYMALSFYLKEEYPRALEFINQALEVRYGECEDLVKRIIQRKLDEPDFSNQYDNEYCMVTNEFYKNHCDEEIYEKQMEPHIKHFPPVIELIVLYDVYLLYKENKKYKKALELLENYIL